MTSDPREAAPAHLREAAPTPWVSAERQVSQTAEHDGHAACVASDRCRQQSASHDPEWFLLNGRALRQRGLVDPH